MAAYEVTNPYQDRMVWVIGEPTDVAIAITGLNAEAMRLPPALHLHPSHADIDYTLPRDMARMREHLAQWSD